jgi:prolyl oligopeptidase
MIVQRKSRGEAGHPAPPYRLHVAVSHRYPPAERLDLVEDLHGHRVADPYRWLENADAPATRAWSQAQDELWQGFAESLPARRSLRARLAELIPGYVGPPHVVGDRRFWTARNRDQDHPALWVADRSGSRVLVDPNVLSTDGTITLDGWAPSLEGDRLAYQLSSGGDEESRLLVLDVASGEVLDGPVDRVRYSPIAWLPGGVELLYVRRLPPAAVPEGESQYHRRVYRHRVVPRPSGASPEVASVEATDPVAADVELFGDGIDMTAYFGVEVSPDGAWVAVSTSLGTAPRNDLHLRRLTPPPAAATAVSAASTPAAGTAAPAATAVPAACHPSPWLPLLLDTDAQASPHFDQRGHLWIHTDLGAPLGRLCRLLPVANPGDLGPDRWEEVVPEDLDGAVMEGFVLAGEQLVVLWRRHAISEVSVHQRADGALLRRAVLPGAGSADLTGRADEAPEVWVGYTDHTTPYQVFFLDLATGELTPDNSAPAAEPDPPAAMPEATPIASSQIVATSADGTEIRLTVVANAANPDQPRPTVLYGYGGFDISLTPTYSSSIRAWVEAGGVWVVAHLRGGSEEGEAWHRDGMRENKHHVFEDFEAAADTLVAEGWTTPDRLGIFGGSNGGLLVGTALTRSPERYAAVVCSAPLLDMIRYERFGLGATWNDEYGTAANPVEFGWLLDMSPYHHVHPGAAYPAVLFTVFESDSRVDPLHARKLAAALQWATSADPLSRPILLRAETQVGHGARSVTRTVELSADQLAFLAHQLGLHAWTSI